MQKEWAGKTCPTKRRKRRDAFVSICFLLSHWDSNSTELPQEGLRMYLLFNHTSSDGDGQYFCFHVTFLFCLWFFFILIFSLLLFQLPALKIWSQSRHEEHHTVWRKGATTAPRTKPTQRWKVIPPVQSWWSLSMAACNVQHPNISQPQHNRNVYYNLLLGIKISCMIICPSALSIPRFRKAK